MLGEKIYEIPSEIVSNIGTPSPLTEYLKKYRLEYDQVNQNNLSQKLANHTLSIIGASQSESHTNCCCTMWDIVLMYVGTCVHCPSATSPKYSGYPSAEYTTRFREHFN